MSKIFYAYIKNSGPVVKIGDSSSESLNLQAWSNTEESAIERAYNREEERKNTERQKYFVAQNKFNTINDSGVIDLNAMSLGTTRNTCGKEVVCVVIDGYEFILN